MTESELNYEPLKSTGFFARAVSWKSAVGIVAIAFNFFVIMSIFTDNEPGHVALGIVGLFPLLFVGLIIGAIASHFIRQKAIRTFAQVNGLTPVDQITLLAAVPPSLANRGHSRKARHGYEFKIASRPVIIFDYQFTVGHGKNSRTYRFGVVTFNTKKSYPHLYLDGKAAGKNYSYDKDQRISLEGDFDKYFSLYAPEAGRVAALAIITPDVMQSLISSASNYDVEIQDTEVGLISGGSLYNYRDLRQVVACVQVITKEFDHRDITWQPVMAADGKPMQLKRKSAWMAIAVIVGVYVTFQIVTILLRVITDL